MPEAPKRELEGMDVVLKGSFNPAIFHAEWFLKHQLIRKYDSKKDIQVVSVQVTQVRLEGITLTCTEDRLTLESPDPASFSRIRDLVAGILKLLPHTPVSAVGINRRIHWKIQSEDYWHTIGNALAPKLVWKELFHNPGMRTLRILAPYKSEAERHGNIITTVEPSQRVRPGLYVSVNMSFTTENPNSEVDTVESALDILMNEWDPAEGWADKVSAKIFERIPEDS